MTDNSKPEKPTSKKPVLCAGKPVMNNGKPMLNTEPQEFRIRDLGEMGTVKIISWGAPFGGTRHIVAQSTVQIPLSGIYLEELLKADDKDSVATYWCGAPLGSNLQPNVAGKLICDNLGSHNPPRYYAASGAQSGYVTHQQLLNATPRCKDK